MIRSFTFFFFISVFYSFGVQAQELNCPNSTDENFDKSACRIRFYNQSYKQQCESLAEYYVKDQYRVDCHYNYHHYNSRAYRSLYRKKIAKQKRDRIRLGGFNILHPVNGKTRFKDLELVAKIINHDFDVLAGIELIPNPKEDFGHNNKIDGFIQEQRAKIASGELSASEKREAEENIEKAINSYLAPGYLRILDHLRELDPSWALIISSRAESAKPNDQKEFTGYYYRSEVVKPVQNKFCTRENVANKGTPFGCTPWFDRDINKAFSRRPFIASFESGDFKFTMVAAHIVFTSPPKAQDMADVLRPAFGVSTLDGFPRGSGVTKETYARWAEVKLTLDLMEKMRKTYNVENIIYVADFNLEKEDSYWSELMKSFPNGQVYVDAKTSISPTSGYASNYDHFIFDPTETEECINNGSVDARRVDFFTEPHIKEYLEDYYHLGNGDWIMDRFMSRFEGKYQAGGRVGSLELEPYEVDREKIEGRLKSQVLNPKKKLPNLNIKIISDHVPVKMTCAIK